MTARFASAEWFQDALVAAETPAVDLYLIGIGHQVPDDLTLAAVTALHRCHTVFGLPPVDSTLLPPMIDLRTFYGHDVPRRVSYEQMVDRVIESAKTAPPVAFVTFGSAMTGVQPAHLLLQLAPRQGLSVRALGGVSFLEGVWSLLARDPFDGFAIWDATLFLGRQVTPPTEADLLLVQAPFLNVTTAPRHGERIDVTPLRDHLLQHYPADHLVSIVLAATGDTPARVDHSRLAELTSMAVDLSSLFIPRMQESR